MDRLNILVTSTGGAVGQGIMKSIKNSPLKTRIITTNSHSSAAGLYRGDSAYIIPLAKSDEFIDCLIDICRKESVHGIMVGLDYELPKLSENKDYIESKTNAKVIVSSPNVIEIADDKWLTNKFLEENGFYSIPSTLHEGLDSFLEKESFPLIIKPRIGDSSKDTFVVNKISELESKLNYLLNTGGSNSYLSKKVNPIIQKYMGKEGDEFTSSTLVFDNLSYGVISMNREMRFGGHTTKAEIKDLPEVNSYLKKVAEKLNPFGPCNFQSRIVNGIPYIFEINARFSGSTATCAVAGFNHVEAAIRKVLLNEKIPELKYKTGTMYRYFNEVFVPEDQIKKIEKEGHLNNPKSKINRFL